MDVTVSPDEPSTLRKWRGRDQQCRRCRSRRSRRLQGDPPSMKAMVKTTTLGEGVGCCPVVGKWVGRLVGSKIKESGAGRWRRSRWWAGLLQELELWGCLDGCGAVFGGYGVVTGGSGWLWAVTGGYGRLRGFSVEVMVAGRRWLAVRKWLPVEEGGGRKEGRGNKRGSGRRK